MSLGLVPAGATATQNGSVPIQSLHPMDVGAIHEIRVLVVMFATRPVMEEAVLTVLVSVTNVNVGAFVGCVPRINNATMWIETVRVILVVAGGTVP